jgi:glycosyltransferase involved in cell wall biosynthesis
VLDRIDFLGGVSGQRLVSLVASATAVVIPSVLESFGLTFYEAMAAGTPVVAADRTFAREALGEVGHYAPAHDGEAMAAAVMPLLDGGERWAASSVASRKRFHAVHWPWQRIGAAYLATLEELA